MPQGWKTTTLCEVLAPKGYIRGPFGSALRRNELLDAGIPVYEQQHAIYDVRGFRFFISKNKFQEMKRFETKMNDLIISCSGTLGKVSIIRESDPKGIISQALLLLRANKDIILPQYLQYFFSSKEGYNAIVSRSSGSVQVNISKRADIEQIPLALPPLNEQKAIVETLGALDDKITNNTKINHHLTETTSATDNSPDIKRGNSVSRRSPKRLNSALFEATLRSIGRTRFSKRLKSFSSGITTEYCMICALSPLGIFVPFDPASIYSKNESSYSMLNKKDGATSSLGQKQRTSVEQPPSKSQKTIFLKYGRILDTSTSPLLNDVVWIAVGRLPASTYPALLGCIFSVEIYVDIFKTLMETRFLLYVQISLRTPFRQLPGIIPPHGSKSTNHDLKIACAICSK